MLFETSSHFPQQATQRWRATLGNIVGILTSILSLDVLFSSLLRSSSSCSSSLMLSSSTLGQKSPSKYGSSLALVKRSSVACLKMSCEVDHKWNENFTNPCKQLTGYYSTSKIVHIRQWCITGKSNNFFKLWFKHCFEIFIVKSFNTLYTNMIAFFDRGILFWKLYCFYFGKLNCFFFHATSNPS